MVHVGGYSAFNAMKIYCFIHLTNGCIYQRLCNQKQVYHIFVFLLFTNLPFGLCFIKFQDNAVSSLVANLTVISV